ncbi:riboflavin biosynthesis protein RibD, partial [Stenotrophomonas maltophilia]
FALRVAGSEAGGATASDTVEHCAHYGRTPPCALALIEAGVSRVVAAMRDPFPKVDGGGFDLLRNAGIEVAEGLMATQARELNKGFL